MPAPRIVYLEERPWLARLYSGEDWYNASCPFCDCTQPLVEEIDPTNLGTFFICLIPWGGCGIRIYVEFERASESFREKIAA